MTDGDVRRVAKKVTIICQTCDSVACFDCGTYHLSGSITCFGCGTYQLSATVALPPTRECKVQIDRRRSDTMGGVPFPNERNQIAGPRFLKSLIWDI